jgi:hypothetical protein
MDPPRPLILASIEGGLGKLSIESEAFSVDTNFDKGERIIFLNVRPLTHSDIEEYENRDSVIVLKTIGSCLFYIVRTTLLINGGIQF